MLRPDKLFTARRLSPPTVNSDDNSRFIQGVVNREDGLLILIDVNKLLAEEEISDLF